MLAYPFYTVQSKQRPDQLVVAAVKDNARRIGTRDRTVGEDFASNGRYWRGCETTTSRPACVDRYSRVTVRTNRYSVPVRLVGRQVHIQLHASHLVVYDGREQVVWHERLIAKGGSRLDLDHHLEGLIRKPGALPGATALEQARAAGRFTPVHDAWWAAARKAHGDAAGTRALIEVLLLHRHMPHEHLVAGLATAVRAGALTADAVALEACKFAEPCYRTNAHSRSSQSPRARLHHFRARARNSRTKPPSLPLAPTVSSGSP